LVAHDNRRVVRAGRQAATLIGFVLLTVLMTWPQARYMSTHVPSYDDPLLSIWRLSWIAHALRERPSELVDGNIFHPEPRTLAYSDAVLLQGFAAAPFLWSGLSPVAVYNTILLLSMALSGWAMSLYATRLTRNQGAGAIAGIVYAFVPFRFDHFMHLELHATFFLPLALLAFDRCVETRSKRDAAWFIAALIGQVYSGLYYAIFLGTALMVVVPVRLRALDRDARAQLARILTPAIVVGALAVTPYLLLYVSNRTVLGERLDRDIELYSATVANYLAATPDNVVHGGWSAGLGTPERRLFPGAAALALALAGAASRARGRSTLLIVGAIGFMLSLGFNTPVYDWIRSVLVPYRGLRAPARAAILVFLAIGGLSAFGYLRLVGRSRQAVQTVVAVAIAAVMLIEYRTRNDNWLALPSTPPQVYRWLRTQPRVVVVEVPFAQARRLDHVYDGLYMFNSTYHWQPLINGYSGFYPPSFMALADEMIDFPDDRAIAALKARGVDLIIVHGSMLGADRFGAVMNTLLARPDLEPTAQFVEANGVDAVFRIRR
jgi:hypothetical protein